MGSGRRLRWNSEPSHSCFGSGAAGWRVRGGDSSWARGRARSPCPTFLHNQAQFKVPRRSCRPLPQPLPPGGKQAGCLAGSALSWPLRPQFSPWRPGLVGSTADPVRRTKLNSKFPGLTATRCRSSWHRAGTRQVAWLDQPSPCPSRRNSLPGDLVSCWQTAERLGLRRACGSTCVSVVENVSTSRRKRDDRLSRS